MKSIEVCLTPELIHQHDLNGKVAVVVDIFRATSCMVAGLSNGVAMIRPVATVDEAFELGAQGYVMAGERGGEKVAGFDLGNSPFEYLDEDLIGRKIVTSTTNGTQAIAKSEQADEIIIGAFLNIAVTAEYLSKTGKDVVIHCAGWKGTVNIEDSLYAGALIDVLSANYVTNGDSAVMAHQLYLQNVNDLLSIAQKSGHADRLAGFGVIKDIEFCVRRDEFDSVISLAGEHLIRI